MPINPTIIAAVAIHFIGMMLITLSFVKIASMVYRLSKAKLKSVCFPGTKLPMYPVFIAFGGLPFLYLTFLFMQISFMPSEFLYELGTGMRFFGTGIVTLGSLIALFGIYKFYNQIIPEAVT